MVFLWFSYGFPDILRVRILPEGGHVFAAGPGPSDVEHLRKTMGKPWENHGDS